MPKEDEHRVKDAIDQLESDRKLQRGRDGRIRLPEMGNEVVGIFRQTRRGFGFVLPEQTCREGDLHISVHETGGALTGDRVRAVVTGRRDRGRFQQPSGRIEEVLKRSQTVFAGKLVRKHGRWMIEPDGRSLRSDVMVGDPHARGAGATAESRRVRRGLDRGLQRAGGGGGRGLADLHVNDVAALGLGRAGGLHHVHHDERIDGASP